MEKLLDATPSKPLDAYGPPVQRSLIQKWLDFIFFPIRAVTLFHKSGLGLTSLADERFDFAASEARGWTLDVGCGRDNRFIAHFLRGRGRGIDLFAYDGLTEENLVPDLTELPFPDAIFDTVTFIANLAHCPEQDRDKELADAFRVTKPGGRIIVTMGHPIIGWPVHKVVWLYDTFLGTKVDLDTERGMKEGEAYYVPDKEILERLTRAGFTNFGHRFFWTQWFLNHLWIGIKPGGPQTPSAKG
jgi:SAM-dependent methyltransferase